MLRPFVLFLCLLFSRLSSYGQCNEQDTAHHHRVQFLFADGLAMYGDKIAVGSYKTTAYGAKTYVRVWNHHMLFTSLNTCDDSVKLTSPEAVAFDAGGNLFVVQTQRPDSNIMVYNSSMTLIKVIDNSPGAASWSNPRGIAFDASGNLYVVSQGDTGTHNTGKLIKINNPLGSATKTVLLTGLETPKGIDIRESSLYLTEFDGNRISRFDVATMTFLDSMHQNKPVDIKSTGCRVYISEQDSNRVRIINATSLDSAVAETITGFDTLKSPSGIVLDVSDNLFVSDNKNNRVVFFRAEEIPPTFVYSPEPYFICLNNYGHINDTTPVADSIPQQWLSTDPLVATVDSSGQIFGWRYGNDTIIHIVGTDTIRHWIYIEECVAGGCQGIVVNLPAFPPPGLSGPGLWLSSDSSVATVTSTGEVHTHAFGLITVMHIFGYDTLSFLVYSGDTVGYPLDDIYTYTPFGVTYGGGTFCVGDAIPFFNDTYFSFDTYAWWTVDDPSTAYTNGMDGVVWPNTTGTTNVIYHRSNGCYSRSAAFSINIEDYPDPGTVSGIDSVCKRSSITLNDTTLLSGIWSTEDTSIATVDGSGIVIGVHGGTATISYSVKNSCGTYAATLDVTVDTTNTGTISATLSGTDSVCTGASITITASIAGGAWSASGAEMSDSVASGFIGDSATIYYSVNGTCGLDTAKTIIYVKKLPVIEQITGDSIVCVASTLPLYDSVNGGKWFVDDATIATIDSNTGVLTGVASGTVNVIYSLTNSCGTKDTFKVITVNDVPIVPGIVGDTIVCEIASINLTDDSTGGFWQISDNTIATVDAGVVTGISAGDVIISYTDTNRCGATTVTQSIAVHPLPHAGVITGDVSVCVSANTTLADTAAGGVWSVAGGVATISSGGVVAGVAIGTVVVSYTNTNDCGTADTFMSITVKDVPIVPALSGADVVCALQTIALTDDSTGGVWHSANSSIASVSEGIVTGLTPGATTISYSVTNTCGTTTVMQGITVNPLPIAGPVSGPSSVCTGDNITLTAPGSGAWLAVNDNASVSVGVVTGNMSGSDGILYIVTNSCGSDTAVQTITINDYPTLTYIDVDFGATGTPYWVYEFCESTTVYMTSDEPGGVWSSPDVYVDPDYGIVYPSGPGGANIYYTVTTPCGSVTQTMYLLFDAIPDPGAISGLSMVCEGAVNTLSSSGDAGGVWTTDNTAAAVISPAGVVTGISASAGAVSAVYTVSSDYCGSVYTSYPILVNPAPHAGIISGPDSVCSGSSITLTGVGSVGTLLWTSTVSAIAAVSSTGVVTAGSTAGAANIILSASNSCGIATAVHPITVLLTPSAGSITGSSAVCEGADITLTNATATPGGTWTSSDNTYATVSGGVVHGALAGAVTISYSVATASCGSDTAVQTITINDYPTLTYIDVDFGATGTPYWVYEFCESTTVYMTSDEPGGVWSSPDVYVDPDYGIVYPSGPGGANIYYTVTTPCGSVTQSMYLLFDAIPDPGAISGPASTCVGLIAALTDVGASESSGTWSSENTFIAGVDGYGNVTPYGVGVVNIDYTVMNVCGYFSTSHAINVNALPVAGSISGPDSMCAGNTITLFDVSTGIISWSSTVPSIASVSSSGVVSAGATAGTTNIVFTIVNSCGTDTAQHAVTVNLTPNAGVITGSSAVCEGADITLANATATPGGIWTSSDNTYATVSGGVVHGALAGAVTISYSVATASCGSALSTYPVTILSSPVVGTLSGPDSVCEGSTITVTETGGIGTATWTSSSAHTSVDATGLVAGNTSGPATITYTTSEPGCGSATATHDVYVNPLPYAGVITGASSVCEGADITLSESATGGMWSSNLPSLASVSGTGVAHGIVAGAAVITYTSHTFSCGDAYTTHAITVAPSPVAGVVYGPDSVCAGSSIVLADTSGTPAGTWSSSAGATIDASGHLSGVAAGSVLVTYTAAEPGCGTANAMHSVDVIALPVAGTITGPGHTCIGSVSTFEDTTSGGVWSLSNGNATQSGGLVTGVAVGRDTLFYTVINSCGTAIAKDTFTVHPEPTVGAITGDTVECAGASITLTDTTMGGLWTASNTHAIVYSGEIIGNTAGTDTIVYAMLTTCGSAFAYHMVTVLASQVSSVSITAVPGATVCAGDTVTFTATGTGGGAAPFYQWQRSGTNVDTGTTYTYVPATGDVIKCYLVSSAVCASPDTVISLPITMIVGSYVTPVVTISVTPNDSVTYSGEAVTLHTAVTYGGSAPTFQWYVNGAPVAGATSSTYSPSVSTNDTLYCVMTSNAACADQATDTSNVIVIYADYLGVSDIHTLAGDINLFPNPNNGRFILAGHVPSPADEQVLIQLLDVPGKVVYSKYVTAKQGYIYEQMDTGDILANGSYMVRVASGPGVVLLHFVVNR